MIDGMNKRMNGLSKKCMREGMKNVQTAHFLWFLYTRGGPTDRRSDTTTHRYAWTHVKVECDICSRERQRVGGDKEQNNDQWEGACDAGNCTFLSG